MPFTAPDSDLVTDDVPATSTPAPGAAAAGAGQGGFIAPDDDVQRAQANAPGGGFIAPAADVLDENGHTPFQAGQAYLQSLDSGQTPLPETWQDHYSAAKNYFDSSATKRLADSAYNTVFGTPTGGQDGGALSNAVQNTENWISNAKNAIYTEATNTKNELVGGAKADIQAGRDAAAQSAKLGIPTLADQYLPQGVNDAWSVLNGNTLASVPATLAATLVHGGYKAVSPVVHAAENTTSAIGHDLVSAAGDAASAGEIEARLDYQRRQYQNTIERPATQLLAQGSGLPATEEALSDLVPLAVPVADAASGAGLIAKASDAAANVAPKVVGRTMQAAGKAGEVVADAGPALSFGGAVHGFTTGGIGPAAGEAILGGVAKAAKPLATGLKDAGQRLATSGPSEFVRAASQPLAGLTMAAGTEAAVQNNQLPADGPLANVSAAYTPLPANPLAGLTREGFLPAAAPMVQMRTPSGASTMIPAADVSAAQAAGFAVVQ